MLRHRSHASNVAVVSLLRKNGGEENHCYNFLYQTSLTHMALLLRAQKKKCLSNKECVTYSAWHIIGVQLLLSGGLGSCVRILHTGRRELLLLLLIASRTLGISCRRNKQLESSIFQFDVNESWNI
jgi:hypothetical protein